MNSKPKQISFLEFLIDENETKDDSLGEVIFPKGFEVRDLENLSPGSKVTVSIHKEDGSTVDIDTSHSLSVEQISWFESGSALNYIKSN